MTHWKEVKWEPVSLRPVSSQHLASLVSKRISCVNVSCSANMQAVVGLTVLLA